MYRIPRIDCNVACPASLEEAFARTVRETVACNNWPADFPYAPQVGFRIFHTGADLLLRFDVAERCTAAQGLLRVGLLHMVLHQRQKNLISSTVLA